MGIIVRQVLAGGLLVAQLAAAVAAAALGLLLVVMMLAPDATVALAATGALGGAELHRGIAAWAAGPGSEGAGQAHVRTWRGSLGGALAVPVLAGAAAFLGLVTLVALVAVAGVGGALCLAWRASQDRLGREDGASLESISLELRRYLDELERADPAGLCALPASGRPIPGDPARRLRSRWPRSARRR